MTAIADKIKELEAQLAVLKSLQQQDPLEPYRQPFPEPLLPAVPAQPPWWGYPHHYGCTCHNCQTYCAIMPYR